MGLVDYSDSDSDSDPSTEPRFHQSPHSNVHLLKRKRQEEPQAKAEQRSLHTPPPLPPSFHDLYASSSRSSTHDDPSLHGGRKRLIPHIEGNWPTHVYLEWHPPSSTHKLLTAVLSTIQSAPQSPETIHTLLTSPLSAPLPLHISLSPPLSLPTPQTTPYLDSLTSALSASKLKSFTVTPSSVDWVPNSSSTRWFLILRLARLSDGEEALSALLQTCNAVARKFGLDELYSPTRPTSAPHASSVAAARTSITADSFRSHIPISDGGTPNPSSSHFHISIAWTLSPPSLVVSDPESTPALADLMEEIRTLQIGFEAVKIKIGNTVTAVSLGDKEGKDRSERLLW